MNTIVTEGNAEIKLSMNVAPFFIEGMGWAHPAVCLKGTRDDLKAFVGADFWGCEVLAVESFAVENQAGAPISLLLSKKCW